MTDEEINAAADAEIARRAFIQKHLSNLPDPYHKMIGRDPNKWAAEAKAAVDSANSDRASYLAGTGQKPALKPEEEHPNLPLNTAKQAQAIKMPKTENVMPGKTPGKSYIGANAAKQAQAIRMPKMADGTPG